MGDDKHDKTPVAIVGAGPCGLALACGLRMRGIPARVLDAAPEPGSGSRAIMLWPPVLEVLDELGVLREAERHGYRSRALCYHTSRGRAVRLPLDATNGALVLQQDRTSRILEAALADLGGKVERPVQVTQIVPGDRSVLVKATAPDGGELSIEADWLVGADGAHSTVRKQLGIEFAGTELSRSFLLAEGRLEGWLDREDAHYFVTPAGVLVLIALPGGEVRISGALAEGEPADREAVQRMLDRRGPGGLQVTELSLLTTFGAPHRVAASMRAGRCFLVGDAAHVHSPAGGQGLSLGMQDVRNLTWKLAGVIDGRLAPSILDSYDLERRAAAGQVVAAIQRMTRQTLFSPMALRARNALLHALHGLGLLQRTLVPSLAGQRVRYPDVLFGAPPPGRRQRARRGARSLPPPGARAPAWALGGGTAGAARVASFRLITAGPEDGELPRHARTLVERAPTLAVHRHVIDGPAGFLLLRPDGYVAASGKATAHLDDAWQRLAGIVRDPGRALAPAPEPA